MSLRARLTLGLVALAAVGLALGRARDVRRVAVVPVRSRRRTTDLGARTSCARHARRGAAGRRLLRGPSSERGDRAPGRRLPGPAGSAGLDAARAPGDASRRRIHDRRDPRRHGLPRRDQGARERQHVRRRASARRRASDAAPARVRGADRRGRRARRVGGPRLVDRRPRAAPAATHESRRRHDRAGRPGPAGRAQQPDTPKSGGSESRSTACSARSRVPSPSVPRRRHASASSSPMRHTSCAHRSRRYADTPSCSGSAPISGPRISPRRCAASRRRRHAWACSSTTSCCSRGSIKAGRSNANPSTSRASRATPWTTRARRTRGATLRCRPTARSRWSATSNGCARCSPTCSPTPSRTRPTARRCTFR